MQGIFGAWEIAHATMAQTIMESQAAMARTTAERMNATAGGIRAMTGGIFGSVVGMALGADDVVSQLQQAGSAYAGNIRNGSLMTGNRLAAERMSAFQFGGASAQKLADIQGAAEKKTRSLTDQIGELHDSLFQGGQGGQIRMDPTEFRQRSREIKLLKQERGLVGQQAQQDEDRERANIAADDARMSGRGRMAAIEASGVNDRGRERAGLRVKQSVEYAEVAAKSPEYLNRLSAVQGMERIAAEAGYAREDARQMFGLAEDYSNDMIAATGRFGLARRGAAESKRREALYAAEQNYGRGSPRAMAQFKANIASVAAEGAGIRFDTGQSGYRTRALESELRGDAWGVLQSHYDAASARARANAMDPAQEAQLLAEAKAGSNVAQSQLYNRLSERTFGIRDQAAIAHAAANTSYTQQGAGFSAQAESIYRETRASMRELTNQPNFTGEEYRGLAATGADHLRALRRQLTEPTQALEISGPLGVGAGNGGEVVRLLKEISDKLGTLSGLATAG